MVPPRNGGALRCYHLCNQLSQHFNLTLLTFQCKKSIKDFLPNATNIVNPSLKNLKKNKLVNALKYRWYLKSLKGPSHSTVLLLYPELKKLAREKRHFDFVILEHLDSSLLGKSIKKLFPLSTVVIDQHNVDHLLFYQKNNMSLLKNKNIYEKIKLQESFLFKCSDYFLGCSQKDVDLLEKLNDYKIEGIIVPNGTTKKSYPVKKSFSTNNIIFCGTLDYEPNKNGLLWFYQEIWSILKETIPNIQLTIIGRNGLNEAYSPLKNDKQIKFIGEVEEVEPFYSKSTLAIVPLLEGSGTRLKILEAMSFGCPVISTTIGAEGIAYTKNKNILIADDVSSFIFQIQQILHNKSTLEQISSEGLKLIECAYNWTEIVNNLSRTLNSKIG